MPLPRGVWRLGWVSFFTDFASEMIYPLLPLFLTRVLGAGAMSLGVIEGVADAANSVLKIAAGHLSDRWNARKPLVVFGYTLSSSVRPLMAAASAWWQVLGLRFVDRLGKGIRGAPRDAMLARLASGTTRGRVFGFHRGMDHAGAVAGPLAAALFLFFYPGEYRTLFALTVIPGAIVIILVATLPGDRSIPAHGGPGGHGEELNTETRRTRRREQSSHQGELGSDSVSPVSPWLGFLRVLPALRAQLPTSLWKVLSVIFLFSLGNASDAFLLLRLIDVGVAAVWIPLLWAALHVVKSSSSIYGGRLSDRLGRKRLIVAGWLWYTLLYAGFACFDGAAALIALFIAYGFYFGLTEGVEKALVADLAPPGVQGTAFGLYNGLLGAGALVSSLLFGWLWTAASPEIAFGTGAAIALAAAALIMRVV
ncbi:MAG: MFS transporter [Vicinamibacterales bacterium]